MDHLSSFKLLTGAVRASIEGRGAPAIGSDAGPFREGITDPIAGVIRDRPGPTGTVAVPAGIADRTVRVIRSVAGRSRADIGAPIDPITDKGQSRRGTGLRRRTGSILHCVAVAYCSDGVIVCASAERISPLGTDNSPP